MGKGLRWLGLGLIGLVVVLQIIPVWALRTNPPVVSEPAWPSVEARALAQRACFDCHSNETVWPWYSYVAPISWLVIIDTVRARNEFNFSDWANAAPREPDELQEQVEEGEMPPSSYVMMHPSANLTEAERQQLVAAFAQMAPGGEGGEHEENEAHVGP